MLLAIYDNGEFVTVQDFEEVPSLEGKPWRQFYTLAQVIPECDSETQVLEGPAFEDDHEAGIRREVWTVRAKTPEELEVEKDAYLARFDPLVLDWLLGQENRVRALGGEPPIDEEEFRAALKAKL